MIRAGLIGAGRMGWSYDGGGGAPNRALSHAACLGRHPDTRLEAVFDSDPAARDRVRKEAAAAGHHAVRVVDDLDALLEQRLDFISICSPTAAHAGHLCRAVEAGARYIWLEKPAVAAPEELELCLARIARTAPSPRIFVNYPRRALPQIARLRELLRATRPRMIEARYSRRLDVNGAHMVDLVAHLLDLKKAPPLDWIQNDGKGDPSFGFTARNIRVAVLGLTLPYHLIELDLIADEGRARLIRGGETALWEPVTPNPDYPGFFLPGPSEPLVEDAATAAREATWLSFCNLLGDGPLASPLAASRATQELMAAVAGAAP